ncbi:hypothetical protein Lal_00000148 [Lupinus albus]|uniref:Putative initiation factor eIF-4 gamma, MA3 n=1 Tax=Lupinus albus TaxID=3870 RepID=A0A6A5LNP9_LUPAL|nr:putative initiation factor eIF-4 gamma, MA3 [Lupinus albus]KAF1860735.1 hypothetical protein Lal_00000148 [Lupinus albus]
MKSVMTVEARLEKVKMMKEFVTVIFDKAVEDTASCPIYCKLLFRLNNKLPPLPSLELFGKDITVKRILTNMFQDCLKSADKKLIPLGNIPFIVELFKQKLVPEWIVHQILDHLLGISWLPSNYVEALCQLLNSIGKLLDKSPKSLKIINDMHFRKLKEFSTNTQLPSKVRFMVCDVLNLRAKKWIRYLVPDLKMNDSLLQDMVFSFLEEYFSDIYSIDVVESVKHLQSPAYHPDIVKEAIFLGLSRIPSCVEGVSDFLKCLFTNCVFSARDIVEGCLLFASLVDDIAIDFPESPDNFGEIIAKLVLAGCLDFVALRDIFREVVLCNFSDLVYGRFLNVISFSSLYDFLSIDLECVEGP